MWSTIEISNGGPTVTILLHVCHFQAPFLSTKLSLYVNICSPHSSASHLNPNAWKVSSLQKSSVPLSFYDVQLCPCLLIDAAFYPRITHQDYVRVSDCFGFIGVRNPHFHKMIDSSLIYIVCALASETWYYTYWIYHHTLLHTLIAGQHKYWN